MTYRRVKESAALLLMMSAFGASAENISVPHSFTSGTTISSVQMNENFMAVQGGINEQAQALSSVETGLDQVRQSTDANGARLDEIGSILSDVSAALSSIDTKLTGTFPATVSDQLICSVSSVSGFVRETSQATCLQKSSPSSTRLIFLSEIYLEGWITQSMSYYGITFVK